MSFTKKSFSIILSKLKLFEKPNVSLEQYPTEFDVAADFLWNAAMENEIEGSFVIDLGAGTGILGFGAALLGAKKVTFVDIDKNAIEIAKQNLNYLKTEFDLSGCEFDFIISDISKFNTTDKYDLVIQNPPFGVKKEHADKDFLKKAFTLSSKIYSLHKTESKTFIEKFSKDEGFKISKSFFYNFPLKSTMHFHTKRIKRIEVMCFKLEKMKD